MTQTIHQEIQVPAAPAAVFAALDEAPEFTKLTGAPSEIDATEGGAFSLFGGMIHGRLIERVEGQRLVQAWRAKNWDAGVYSVVRFELRASDGGTMIVLDHSGFPEGQAEHLAEGWQANYWKAMAELS